MKNKELEQKLIVGAKIRIGKKYAEDYGYGFGEGMIITLKEGQFEYDNGLYTETQYAPAFWNKENEDWDSIYHLFGNDLDEFMDCEIV